MRRDFPRRSVLYSALWGSGVAFALSGLPVQGAPAKNRDKNEQVLHVEKHQNTAFGGNSAQTGGSAGASTHTESLKPQSYTWAQSGATPSRLKNQASQSGLNQNTLGHGGPSSNAASTSWQANNHAQSSTAVNGWSAPSSTVASGNISPSWGGANIGQTRGGVGTSTGVVANTKGIATSGSSAGFSQNTGWGSVSNSTGAQTTTNAAGLAQAGVGGGSQASQGGMGAGANGLGAGGPNLNNGGRAGAEEGDDNSGAGTTAASDSSEGGGSGSTSTSALLWT